MEKTTIYLNEQTRSRLRALARRSGRSQADLIREALTRFLDEGRGPEPELPRFVAAFGVGGDAGVDKGRLREQWQFELGQKGEGAE
jgi:plasmid stability protein